MLRIFHRPVAWTVNRAMTRHDAKIERGKTLPEGVTAHTDIDYVGDGCRGHLLDVYVPEVCDNLPVLIDIHGGGLIYGYKEINKRFCYEMARLGFVVVSISYRLVPSVTLLDQLRDVTAAFRWVTENFINYTDCKDIYIAGDSAGAFLALYGSAMTVSATLREVFGNEGSALRAKGLFLVSGMYDILAGGYLKSLCECALPKGYKSSPIYKYLDIKELLAEYTPPPSFITSSAEDMLAFHTEKYIKLLEELGLPYEYDFKEKLKRKKGEKSRAFVHVYPVRQPEWEESADVLRRAAQYLLQSHL